MNEENNILSFTTPDQKAFGLRLTKFREKYGLSLSDLARICVKYKHASRTSIYRVEKGTALEPVFQSAVPALEKTLREWMAANNFTSAEQEADLDDLFQFEERIMNHTFKRTLLPGKVTKFFGFKYDPFDADRVPLDDEIFHSAELDEICDRIKDAILYKRFTGVLGAVGEGKTAMKVRVARELMADNAAIKVKLISPEAAYMSDLKPATIALAILEELGVKAPQNAHARVKAIRHHLSSLEKDDVRIALVIEESHHLNPKVITSLKNFWELTNGQYSRLLSIVLFAQPQFESILREQKFTEIAERIDLIQMPSIAKSAKEYLAHKLATVGGDIKALFEPKALDKICRVGRTPLQLGNIANMALIEAYNREEMRVDVGMLKLPETSLGIIQKRAA